MSDTPELISGSALLSLRAALLRLEAACNQRAKLLTPEAYLVAELIPGMPDALRDLDDARRVSLAALEACESKTAWKAVAWQRRRRLPDGSGPWFAWEMCSERDHEVIAIREMTLHFGMEYEARALYAEQTKGKQ